MFLGGDSMVMGMCKMRGASAGKSVSLKCGESGCGANLRGNV